MVGSWFLVKYIKTEGVRVKLLCSCSYQNSSVNALHNVLRRNRIKFMSVCGNTLALEICVNRVQCLECTF
jgi:hypothetical protein